MLAIFLSVFLLGFSIGAPITYTLNPNIYQAENKRSTVLWRNMKSYFHVCGLRIQIDNIDVKRTKVSEV